MNKHERDRFAKLVAACQTALANPAQQSIDMWRGDMRAIIAAAKALTPRPTRKQVKAGRYGLPGDLHPRDVAILGGDPSR